MNGEAKIPARSSTPTDAQSLGDRVGQWLQDPLGSVVAASAATIGSFGFVLSGMWFISLAIN